MGNTGKSSFQLKILYGEGNPDVLASQAVSIQKAGHEVKTAVGRKGVLDALKAGTFDLVILGPTLTRDDRHHLPYIVKKTASGTRVLVMHSDGARHPQVDANIDTGRSIDELLAKVTTMLAGQAVAQ
jgi:DNA-binding NtrC family response regulator